MSAWNHQISTGLSETEKQLVPENVKGILDILLLAEICEFYVSLPSDRDISEAQIQELERAFAKIDRERESSLSDELQVIRALSVKILSKLGSWRAKKHERNPEPTPQNDSSDACLGPRGYPKREHHGYSNVFRYIEDKINFSMNVIVMSLDVDLFIWAKTNLTVLRLSMMAVADVDETIRNHKSGQLWRRESFKETMQTLLGPLLDMHTKFGVLNYLELDERFKGQHLLLHVWGKIFLHLSCFEIILSKAIDAGLIDREEARKLAGVLVKYGFDPGAYAGNSDKLPRITKEKCQEDFDVSGMSFPLPRAMFTAAVADQLAGFRRTMREDWELLRG